MIKEALTNVSNVDTASEVVGGVAMTGDGDADDGGVGENPNGMN